MKKLFLFAAAAVALASCSDSQELAVNEAQQETGRGEVAFSVYANRTTRAGKGGVMDINNLKGEDGGIGIFGYHTNNMLYDPQNSVPNFMYNQKVTTSDGSKWTYDPVKYWPNEFGDNAVSNDIDYVSFFAYAPYVDVDPISGVALAPEGCDTFQTQWKNITGVSRNGDKGDPMVRYRVDTNPSTSVDLMWGVALNDKFKGLANPAAAVVNPDECFINLSKQVGVNQTIDWKFYHALTKLNIQIIAASDVATEGTTAYDPTATTPIPIDEFTRVYLRWIEFTGFAMNGALNLNSKAPKPHWLNYDGATELKSTTVRFNDGLLNGKEGIADNKNPNEVVLGALNPVLIEESTPLVGPIVDNVQKSAWMGKNAGIPTDDYVNVFAGATADKSSIFVIPTNEELEISMLYDIETQDTLLNKYLSDGVTPGTHIACEISKKVNAKIVAGKAYDIKIVVGLESVKVNVEEVADWELPTDANGNEIDTTKVDMPYNPARKLVLDMEGCCILNGINYENTSDVDSYKRPVPFKVIDRYTDANTSKTYLRVQKPNTLSVTIWVEEGATADNGKYHQTYWDTKQLGVTPTTYLPGDPTPTGTHISPYNEGDFSQVKFYTARPFEVGMEGTYLNGEKIIGTFVVSEGWDDPVNEVHVKVTYGNNSRSGEFLKSEKYVNTGNKEHPVTNKSSLDWYGHFLVFE